MLALLKDDCQCILDTDASDRAIDAVLSVVQDSEEKVLSYASRLYSDAEINYCVTRKELLAVVYYVKYSKQHLLGRQFLVRTDHSALQWLRRTPEPIGQQARWLEISEGLTFTIQHRPGRQHSNADALSRIPCRQCGVTDNVNSQNTCLKTTSAVQPNQFSKDWSHDSITKARESDPEMAMLYKAKTDHPDCPPDSHELEGESKESKAYFTIWNLIEVHDVLYMRSAYQPESGIGVNCNSWYPQLCGMRS